MNDIFDDISEQRDAPTPEEALGMMGLCVNRVHVGTFLEGVLALKEHRCDAIFGPQGGLLELNQYKELVYHFSPKLNLIFTANDILGQWLQFEIWKTHPTAKVQ